jgi:hypothetical protein
LTLISLTVYGGKGKGKREVKAAEAFACNNTEAIMDSFSRGIHKERHQARKIAIPDLKSYHNKLCGRISGLELKMTQQVCSSTKELKPSTNALTGNLKTKILRDVNTWRKYWKDLKPKIPGKKIQSYTEENKGVRANDGSNGELFNDCYMLYVAKRREDWKVQKKVPSTTARELDRHSTSIN